jgi:hypothetical protein
MLIRGLIGGPAIAIQLWKELIHRLTGLSREASLPATMLAALILARALHRHPASPTRHLAKVVRPRRPSLSAPVMTGAVLRHTLRSVAGEHVNDTPYAGTMIGLGLTVPALSAVAALAALPVYFALAVLRAFSRALRAA